MARVNVRETNVKVYITDSQDKLEITKEAELLVKSCCAAVLKYEGFTDLAEISVSFVDNEHIRELNSRYRNKDSATDVLSFPLGEDGMYDINEETGACLLGDIVISTERAMEQAEQYGHSLEREIGFLTVHSMLHLLGYDHENGEEEESVMRSKQSDVLKKLRLTRE